MKSILIAVAAIAALSSCDKKPIGYLTVPIYDNGDIIESPTPPPPPAAE